jgi:flagellar M-ring protein FliF
MGSLQQLMIQFWRGFNALAPSRRMTILGVAAASLLGMGLLIYMANQVDYRVLFSNLSNEDAGNIVARLQEKKVSYRLSPSGDSIMVPAEKVSELRLEMATSGLPQGGGVGFEIFDTKSLGATEFVQQLNYQRALQGELSRTINGLDEIQHSRVHLVIPKKSLFLEDQKKATASVILRLKPGRSLRSPQIEGIAHLVASSIEGLSPADVMVVDNSGKVLSKIQDESKLARLSSSQIEYQRNIEKDLTGRVQSMLEKVVGEGKAVVRVTADLDFRMTEKTEEKYDPEEPVVRSVQRASEKSDDGSESRSQGRKSDEVINYEINRVVNKTVMPVGDIKKLSIAVLVDGNYLKNDKGVEEFQPRSKKEIADLEELVKKAAGFDPKREDQVVVTNVPFKRVDADAGMADGESWKDRIAAFVPVIKYLSLAAGIICLILFIFRPMMKMLLAKGKEAPVGAWAAGAAGELPAGASPLALGEETGRGMTETDVVRQMADADARRFAELLRNWLK